MEGAIQAAKLPCTLCGTHETSCRDKISRAVEIHTGHRTYRLAIARQALEVRDTRAVVEEREWIPPMQFARWAASAKAMFESCRTDEFLQVCTAHKSCSESGSTPRSCFRQTSEEHEQVFCACSDCVCDCRQKCARCRTDGML